MENEALIRYKFYLCRKFLDKLLTENLITEARRKKSGNVALPMSVTITVVSVAIGC